jgi:hypothetical protein
MEDMMFKDLMRNVNLRVYAVIPEYIENHFRLGDNKKLRVQKFCEYLTDKTGFKFAPNTYKGKNSKGEESVCVLNEEIATAEQIRDIINSFAKDFINESYFKIDDINKSIRCVFEVDGNAIENIVVKESAIEYIKRKEGIKDFDIPVIPCVEEYKGKDIDEDYVDPLFVDAPTVRIAVGEEIKYRINVGDKHKVRKGILSRLSDKEISIRESAKLSAITKQKAEYEKLRKEVNKEYEKIRELHEVNVAKLERELDGMVKGFMRDPALAVAKKFSVCCAYIGAYELNYRLNDNRDMIKNKIKAVADKKEGIRPISPELEFLPKIEINFNQISGGLTEIAFNISAINDAGFRYSMYERVYDDLSAKEIVSLIEKRCNQYNKLHNVNINWFK